MEKCHPDALHLLSEGVTCDLFKEMFWRSGTRVPELQVQRDALPDLCAALHKSTNYTYASKFVLGIEDFSSSTVSEKDVLMFVLFPLVAALQLCTDPLGNVCLLSYWILVRFLEKTTDLKDDHIPLIRGLAYAMKFLWCEVSRTLFTLKTHIYPAKDPPITDQLLVSKVFTVGCNYASPRQPQTAKRQFFIMRKEFYNMMKKEAGRTANPIFRRSTKKLRVVLRIGKEIPVHLTLNSTWYVPTSSAILFQSMHGAHQSLLLPYRRDWKFSLRMCCSGTVYSSRYYWKRRSETMQDCVCLAEGDNIIFGIVIAFAFERRFCESTVLLDEFVTENPFDSLHSAICNGPSRARLRALNALNFAQEHNCFFKRVSGLRLVVENTFDILGPAILLHHSSTSFVSRL
ncbi:hypothetical protein ANCCAN_04876 [Ancylostoma caninum]|uniref:Uncharacterized protein n=1 Tax=Ancylostoma caninum TaxID=29170 RepID=A0A368H074_ANCCA|nr:hypothetical protein ANCCAN_04876 [Ancylostoma caninum]